MSNSSTKEILLSTTQSFQKHDVLPLDATHPFSSSAEESCTTLQHLINTADQVGATLSIYSSTIFSNPKLVSLLRQHSSIAHTLHQLDRNTGQVIDALQKQPRLSYGADVPLNPVATVQWCVSQLETWGTSAGMETFKDNNGGGISLVLGGKVLVIDVDLTVTGTNSSRPELSVFSIKTSYAIANAVSGTPSNGGSPALDSFLYELIWRFCTEAQKPPQTRNLQEVAKLGDNISEQLQYLVMLDKLADRKKGGGLKWFGAVDELSPVLENYARRESAAVASSLNSVRTPLDVHLLRSHSLPLPYLFSPSVSFLVHLSPLCYLTLVRSQNQGSLQDDGPISNLDIPLPALRPYLRNQHDGAVLATLTLLEKSAAHIFPVSMSVPGFASRPTFPLDPQGAELEYEFPQVADITSYDADDNGGHYTWHLDFTNGRRNPGIVMSQTRMRDIELILNPLVDIDTYGSVDMLSFGSGSWVNLILSPYNDVHPERYTALYVISPRSLHPPLHLRLTVPDEPGFRLERVPVRNMKEVWGILEVVREQCWLNEIISSCEWAPDGIDIETNKMPEETPTSEEELQAILTGNVTPRKLPVNVYVPPPSSSFSELDSMGISHVNHRGPRIVMTFPEHPPISGMVEITVGYDESRPRGVSVSVSGAMGADVRPENMEEISRRGGTLGLPGRVWSKAHGNL